MDKKITSLLLDMSRNMSKISADIKKNSTSVNNLTKKIKVKKISDVEPKILKSDIKDDNTKPLKTDLDNFDRIGNKTPNVKPIDLNDFTKKLESFKKPETINLDRINSLLKNSSDNKLLNIETPKKIETPVIEKNDNENRDNIKISDISKLLDDNTKKINIDKNLESTIDKKIDFNKFDWKTYAEDEEEDEEDDTSILNKSTLDLNNFIKPEIPKVDQNSIENPIIDKLEELTKKITGNDDIIKNTVTKKVPEINSSDDIMESIIDKMSGITPNKRLEDLDKLKTSDNKVPTQPEIGTQDTGNIINKNSLNVLTKTVNKDTSDTVNDISKFNDINPNNLINENLDRLDILKNPEKIIKETAVNKTSELKKNIPTLATKIKPEIITEDKSDSESQNQISAINPSTQVSIDSDIITDSNKGETKQNKSIESNKQTENNQSLDSQSILTALNRISMLLENPLTVNNLNSNERPNSRRF